jgi:hypothetical protein
LIPQWTPDNPKQGRIDITNLPSDLAQIVAAWPKLPEHIRAAVLALVRSTFDKEQTL